MNLQFYLEKLFVSKEFEKFKKENSSAYFCSGFIVINIEEKAKDQVHIDYFNPETRKMFSFQLEKLGVTPKGVPSVERDENTVGMPIEQVPEKNPEKISDNVNFEFEKIRDLVEEKMQEEGIKSRIQKILLSLQKKDGSNFLIGTVFISALGMLKVNIDLEKMKIIEFEKKSLFDMLKVVKKK